jgi:glyceraldehyde-3-phosphate dehydrogenase/erythrose-4-phosphate dehydrogenase
MDPSAIAWCNSGATYIVESTGAFTSLKAASAHMQGGAEKVTVDHYASYSYASCTYTLHCLQLQQVTVRKSNRHVQLIVLVSIQQCCA